MNTPSIEVRPFGEANTQAEFYHQCRLIGLHCILEFSTPVGRLDCAILNKTKTGIIAIVEVKRQTRGFSKWQIKRYKKIGVPVFGLNDFNRCNRLAVQIQRDYLDKNTVEKTFEEIESIPRYFRGRRKKFSPMNLDEDFNYRE